MSRRKVPPHARLLVSAIYRDEKRFRDVLPGLEARLGPVERTSGPFPFDRTDYYEREMGTPLFRRFVVLKRLVPRDALVAAKIDAEDLEKELSANGMRTVNLDPGLLTEENVLLATGKNYSHRVYLRDGVFADLALVYRKGEYRPLPWTYPDLASDGIRAFLAEVREELREARKQEGRPFRCG
ncbi:MAG TPA: DUF4416 family protein [Candidatus Limnocylindrales bacterium]|nr:DUF4416 family protein [Candidatus Limnocylindrales bacterium]